MKEKKQKRQSRIITHTRIPGGEKNKVKTQQIKNLPLSTETLWSLTEFSFIICQNKSNILPSCIFINCISVFVINMNMPVWISFAISQYCLFTNIINRQAKIMLSVGECTVCTIFNTVSSSVRFINAHSGFIIPQMVSTFRITGGAMQVQAPGKKQKE